MSIRQKILSAVDVSVICPAAKKSASRSYPLQLLADFAGAVLDNETGKILEYCHIIKRPKYKKYWGYSFGNKIGRLEQVMLDQNTGTNTIFFIQKDEITN